MAASSPTMKGLSRNVRAGPRKTVQEAGELDTEAPLLLKRHCIEAQTLVRHKPARCRPMRAGHACRFVHGGSCVAVYVWPFMRGSPCVAVHACSSRPVKLACDPGGVVY